MHSRVKMQKGDEVIDVWMIDAKELLKQGWEPVDDDTPISKQKKPETPQQKRRKARTRKVE